MDNFVYSTKQVSTMFGVTIETVRNWSQEFADYLSHRANPGKKRNRSYTQQDLEVFALVSNLKHEGLTFEDVHVALRNGERSTPPPLPPNEPLTLTTGKSERELAITIAQQEQTIALLRQQLIETHAELEELRQVRERSIRLEERLETATHQVSKLEERITELTQKTEELSKEVGQQYARGYTNGIDYERGQPND
jgi:DNA-binding transcriptional MerR regulator